MHLFSHIYFLRVVARLWVQIQAKRRNHNFQKIEHQELCADQSLLYDSSWNPRWREKRRSSWHTKSPRGLKLVCKRKRSAVWCAKGEGIWPKVRRQFALTNRCSISEPSSWSCFNYLGSWQQHWNSTIYKINYLVKTEDQYRCVWIHFHVWHKTFRGNPSCVILTVLTLVYMAQ